ncbi:MAG TPA: hypothetical protein VN326_09315 [Casimicrobiaceae bacterium]|nr:hypothetical protein [Casimicrobiaceae bacterium]
MLLQLTTRCDQQLAGWLAVLGVVVTLVGCGAPEESARAVPESSARAAPESATRAVPESSTRAAPEGPMRPVPVEVVLDAGARPVGASDALPIIAPVLPKVERSPFELVGTSISSINTFAVLKEGDQNVLTVHEGDRIDGYTIATIAPDRVRVRSPDNDERLLMLVAATGNLAAPTTRASGVPPEPMANTALIADGINTDQSIPEHVTFGPTGTLPEGVRQMGH